MDSNFYVYEWYNIDTNEVFYVGKGKNRRYKDISNRNQYFLNYYNKYNCVVRKVRENLEENVAFDYEVELIRKYKEKGQCKCNLTEGGEGSTFPEGSREYICARLRALYNLKEAMDDMPNEEDYDPINYKDKSTEELKKMYDDYYKYKESLKDYNVDKEEYMIFSPSFESDYDELIMHDKEVKMLTKLIAERIAKDNREFQSLIDCEDEMDYMLIDFDTEKLIAKMLEYKEYKTSLNNLLHHAINSMRIVGRLYPSLFFIKIKSFKIKGRHIDIKFKISEDKGAKRTKIDIYDIVWGVLIFDNKNISEIIHEELLLSPIYKG